MDSQTSTALGIAGIASGVLSAIYTYMKHSKCHSNCLGKPLDFSMDITPTETPKDKLFIKVDGSSDKTKEADKQDCSHCSNKKEQV
jgi:hypothetical protein